MKNFSIWSVRLLSITFLWLPGAPLLANETAAVHHSPPDHSALNATQKVDGSPIESLSPELRTLLSKEMVAIQQGMTAIIPAYVSGSWSEIEQIARRIKNSYILKQSLTDHQLHELHSTLPEGFIKQDQHFHYLSGMLEHAASNKKAELVGFYFSKMSESCVSCHSQYASHRFPALAPSSKAAKHLH
jgi:hypothetical protein